ncbi:MAG: SLBB domain-containing protein, partial [Spirochaetaceae bacterium]|nr:SLBB domain-containing protein [Spirochaetaceae bacterium]
MNQKLINESFSKRTVSPPMRRLGISAVLCICSLSAAYGQYDFSLLSGQISAQDKMLLAISSPDYIVTAGDVYALSFSPGISASGSVQTVQIPITIDTSYRVRVANFGVANAAGKTYQQLKRQVEAIVLENYPLSPVQFVMVQPASFSVFIKGEVTVAATIPAWALSRLSEVLAPQPAKSSSGQPVQTALLGGQQTGATQSLLTEYASIRDISILSRNGETKTYDLFTAMRAGDRSQDPYLRPGDIITVKRLSRRINVAGAVERPGAYQLLDGENLQAAIEKYAGGFTRLSDRDGIEILRYTGNTDTKQESVLLKVAHQEYEDDKELWDYDYVTVRPTTNMHPAIFIDPAKNYFVTVAGSVRMPGRYPYMPDRTWEYYIALA